MTSSPDDLLSFKEFPPMGSNEISDRSTAEIKVNSPEKKGHVSFNELLNEIPSQSGSMGDQGQGLPLHSGDTKPPSYSFLTIEYYQQFFNVDTLMVVDRIASSMIPKRAPTNYLKSHIGDNPDLYGPFWILVTLIFSIAISGNIADYLQNTNINYHWRYNFHLVSYAATAIFLYACLIPIALWGLFKWSLKPVEDDAETNSGGFAPSLLALMCIYGYSLAIYVPVSILWVIQISFLQWLLVITAAFLSGSVLILILTPALRNSNISLFLIIGILVAHFTLAAGFMLYFFHVPNSVPIAPVEHLMLPSTMKPAIKMIDKALKLSSVMP